jgi:nicotinamidase/pyrazinamidase
MRTVFFDIDTQLDFLFPAGALYVPGAEALLPALARLRDYAAARGIPIVSSTDAHAEDDPEFLQWPPHCVAGTLGQQKPPETLLEPRRIVPVEPGDYPLDGARQILVEKRALDVFSNPNLPRLLEALGAERCVLYGVVTEYCVRAAALGLLKTGRQVELVTDAVRSLEAEAERRTLREIEGAGGRLTTLDMVLASGGSARQPQAPG